MTAWLFANWPPQFLNHQLRKAILIVMKARWRLGLGQIKDRLIEDCRKAILFDFIGLGFMIPSQFPVQCDMAQWAKHQTTIANNQG